MDGNAYIRKFGFPDKLFSNPPARNLEITIVIPAYREENIKKALLSLVACEKPPCGVEILILVNYPSNSEEFVKLESKKIAEELESWSGHIQSDNFAVHICTRELPEKFAGVGLARKLLMDEAVTRFSQLNREGIIANFDADCTCDENYLTSLYNFFKSNPQTPGCSIYFEHDLKSAFNEAAILDYELYLRYYITGLRFAKYPYAFHTLGSAMAVRTNSYCQQGGMNKRKAAEDFHFLHKIIPVDGYKDLTSTRVIPSSRVSERVPFGTGKAMKEWHSKELKFWPAFDVRIFELIKNFLGHHVDFYNHHINELWIKNNLPVECYEFLVREDFPDEISLLKETTTTRVTFSKAFFRWFNGLKVLQFAHYLRDFYFPSIPVQKAARELLKKLNLKFDGDSFELLEFYRKLDRLDQVRKV